MKIAIAIEWTFKLLSVAILCQAFELDTIFLLTGDKFNCSLPFLALHCIWPVFKSYTDYIYSFPFHL